MEQNTLTLGEKIDKLSKLRADIRIKNKEVERLEGEKKALEAQVMEHMDVENIGSSRGKLATASISESVVPSVTDWDTFWAYVFRNKASHLLERRPHATAYREELETRKGKPIPGVQPYTRRTLNLRDL